MMPAVSKVEKGQKCRNAEKSHARYGVGINYPFQNTSVKTCYSSTPAAFDQWIRILAPSRAASIKGHGNPVQSFEAPWKSWEV
jgi:hypothetical protein